MTASRPAAQILTAKDFFAAVQVKLAGRLPPQLRGFDSRPGPRLLKFDYGHRETHFEVWHHRAVGRLEVGLHFEGDRALNDRAREFFRAHMVQVKGTLSRAELEPWDRGWSRLYETLPGTELNDQLLDQASDLLAAYICTLEPLLENFWEA